MGAVFATTVGAGTGDLPFGVVRLLMGLAFSLGLVMVIVGGAELFTGNTLIVMAWAGGKARTADVLRNWAIVYFGNFAGSFCTAALVYAAGQYQLGGGAVGTAALAIAHGKASVEFLPAVASGVLCNALVCLAVWMCFAARSTVDRVVAIVPPIAAFVAAGFEHCVANMYFFPVALFVKGGAPEFFWTAIGRRADDYPRLTWERFLVGNLLPVTLGNLIGGSVLVGATYWFVYLRGKS